MKTKKKTLAIITETLLLIFAFGSCFLVICQKPVTKPQNPDEIFAAAQKAYKEGQSVNDKSTIQDIRSAISKMQTASSLFEEIKKWDWAGVVYIETGWKYEMIGEWDKCLENYKQAEKLFQQTGNASGEAVALNSAGWIYRYSGKFDEALKNHEKAEILYESVNDLEGQAMTISSIGGVYIRNGQDKKALDYLWRSLKIRQQLNKEFDQGMNFLDIGMAYRHLGETEKAIFYLKKDYEIMLRYNSDWGLSNVLDELGGCYLELGKLQDALKYYSQELYISRRLTNTSHTGTALSNLMEVWSNLQNPYLAMIYGKEAVNTFQEFRSRSKKLDKDVQKTYLKLVEPAYRHLADLLIAHERIAEAEQVLSMLKEEEYFDFVRRDDGVAKDLKATISLSPTEKEAFDNYEKFADDITRIGAEFSKLERQKNALPLGESLSHADQKQYEALKQKLDNANAVFTKFLNDLKVKFAQKGEQYAGTVKLESDTQGVLKKLDEPHTVIISTIVGEDRLNLIVTTADTQRAHIVEIKATEINKLVSEFRAAVKNPFVDPRPSGKKLFDILFPVALQQDLENIKAKTIVWSLDGTLRYVPMPALWDGKQYLVERFTNVVLTLASRDKISETVSDRTKWLALGVGVSKSASIKNSDGTTANFGALTAVPQELCSIISDPKKKEFCLTAGIKQTGIINGLLLPDDEFTLSGFQNFLGRTPVIHIASHFSLNAGNEVDSYLLLGGGTERKFSLVNLRNTRLDKVELLVLSACNTAMSAGNNSSGVEIEGFGALAQNQGAKTVLATLWAVADDSTRDLMKEFYRILETNPKIGKGEALRNAQLALLNNESKTVAATKRAEMAGSKDLAQGQPKYEYDPKKPFAHPYYWSPFVLIGNWK